MPNRFEGFTEEALCRKRRGLEMEWYQAKNQIMMAEVWKGKVREKLKELDAEFDRRGIPKEEPGG